MDVTNATPREGPQGSQQTMAGIVGLQEGPQLGVEQEVDQGLSMEF